MWPRRHEKKNLNFTNSKQSTAARTTMKSAKSTNSSRKYTIKSKKTKRRRTEKTLAKKVHKICTRSVKIVHKTHATFSHGALEARAGAGKGACPDVGQCKEDQQRSGHQDVHCAKDLCAIQPTSMKTVK